MVSWTGGLDPSNQRRFVLWNPHPSHIYSFAMVSGGLGLYEVNEGLHPRGSSITTRFEPAGAGAHRLVRALSAQPPDQAVTCIEWDLREQFATRLAVGTANGNTLLIEFDPAKDEEYVPSVFKPRYGRRANCVAFNPHQPAQMAVGLEKVRNDDCAVIWDVTHSLAGYNVVEPSTFQIGRGLIESSRTVNLVQTPMYQFSHSESINSLAWLTGFSNCLAVGAGRKWVRIYDCRSLREPVRSLGTHARSIRGVVQQPFFEHQVASYSDDGTVKIWDLRKGGKTSLLTSLSIGKSALQIEWSPTKSNVLAVISSEESTLKLFDLSKASLEPGQESRPDQSLRLQPFVKRFQTPLESIDWHPSQPNTILALARSGTIHQVIVHDQVPLSWSPHATLASARGPQILADASLDTTIAMKQRLERHYALDAQINLQVLQEMDHEASVGRLWEWLGRQPTGQGIASLLAASSASINPSVLLAGRLDAAFPYYQSEAREQAIAMLGWFPITNSPNSPLSARLDQLEHDHHYERAAALALFHLDLERALQSLRRGGESEGSSQLNLVALALAGYGGGQNTSNDLWMHTCRSVSFNDPYLRAAFALVSGGEWQEAVLGVEGMDLQDLVAFACRFLDDTRLGQFVDEIMQRSEQHGLIDGLILTGIGPAAIPLLQSYLDRTGDIQTTALISCYAAASIEDASSLQRVHHWIDEYRDLIDRWKMWHHRARLDIERKTMFKDLAPIAPKIAARCSYCNKSLSLDQLSAGRSSHSSMLGVARSSGPAESRARINSCPNCKKPLPRCSVCLLPLDCAAPPSIRHRRRTMEREDPLNRDSPNAFDRWISWCQSCHHAGHAGHMKQWFATHDECPVTGCDCRCSTRDVVRSLFNGLIPPSVHVTSEPKAVVV